MKKIIIYIFILIGSQSVLAFEVFSNVKTGFSDSKSITFNYNITACSDQTTTLSNITSALKVWSNIPMSRLGELKLGVAVSTTAAQAFNDTDGTYSYPPVIICDPSFKTTFASDSPTNDVSLGYGGTIASGGNVIGGYVIFNVDSTSSTGYYQNLTGFPSLVVTTHELGHSLGLAHSTDPEAMMKSGGNSTMSRDDFEGIRYLYPRNELFDKSAFGCGSVSTKSVDDTKFSIIVLILLSLPLIITFRLRAHHYKA